MKAVQSLADVLTILRKSGLDMAQEPDRDIHSIDRILEDPEQLDKLLKAMQGGASGQFNPKKLKDRDKHFGPIWDYRHLTQPNGGKINVLIHVDHIPVIRQMPGRADLDVLWRVLRSQGLMVQRATDGDGAIAYYTQSDRLCYHARGANSFGPGTEHMHLLTTDAWSSRQLNAAAYIRAMLYETHGLPMGWGRLGSGSGFVTVRKRGHTGHKQVSIKAGFFDRSDPGDRFPENEVRDRAVFYHKHHRF